MALLEIDAQARALREEAAQLDILLNTLPAPQASPELMAAILADAAPTPWRKRLARLWPYGPIWRPAMTLAASAAMGVMAGVWSPEIEALWTPPAQVAEMAQAEQSVAEEGFAMLAFGLDNSAWESRP
ncbi:hypothetical protein MAIT1_00591 [Magnetofaba australis IT-1]|uniref:Uncharacterized protein n=1 Tax=Magnetofaba australis IT-1 TaxID=1434232 RepID=A0A1Y2K083_9PROT|nr:hypothetical protein MAIT1_00591 [Magnetofaba australis IT-1]